MAGQSCPELIVGYWRKFEQITIMIFKFLFRRKIREWQTRIDNVNQEIKILKVNYAEISNLLSKQEMRFKRIQYLVNERLLYSEKLLLEKTDKGIDILTSVSLKRAEIEIFNIDCEYYAENRSLVLWFRKENDIIKIEDIQGGNSLGHGSVAIRHLVDFAKRNNVTRIIGEISVTNNDHLDRLSSFYEKNQFLVDKVNWKLERVL